MLEHPLLPAGSAPERDGRFTKELYFHLFVMCLAISGSFSNFCLFWQCLACRSQPLYWLEGTTKYFTSSIWPFHLLQLFWLLLIASSATLNAVLVRNVKHVARRYLTRKIVFGEQERLPQMFFGFSKYS